jgi:hypothetical protein
VIDKVALRVLRFFPASFIPPVLYTPLHLVQKDKWAKPGNLQTKHSSSEYGGQLDRNVLSPFLSLQKMRFTE